MIVYLVVAISNHSRRIAQVWPALAVVGGLDPGLRAGGVCVSKTTGRRGTILGVSREGATSAKVLWEDSEASVRCVRCVNACIDAGALFS